MLLATSKSRRWQSALALWGETMTFDRRSQREARCSSAEFDDGNRISPKLIALKFLLDCVVQQKVGQQLIDAGLYSNSYEVVNQCRSRLEEFTLLQQRVAKRLHLTCFFVFLL